MCTQMISLLDDPELVIASGRRVFSKRETGALLTIEETLEKVKTLKQGVEDQLRASQEEAREKGHQEGMEQGRQDAKKELTARLLELEKQYEVRQARVESEIVSLALQVVRKIAADLAPADTLVALATGAVTEQLANRSISLKVHPEHLEPVQQRLDSLQSNNSPCAIACVVADVELQPSDCVLETPDGQVCADLETQLLAIEQHFSSQPSVSVSPTLQNQSGI